MNEELDDQKSDSWLNVMLYLFKYKQESKYYLIKNVLNILNILLNETRQILYIPLRNGHLLNI